MSEQVLVPDLGDFKDVEVIDVLVKAGDTIAVDTPLLTIETDKATMDVPSTTAGVVKAVALKKGDRVSKGALILELAGVSGSGLAVSQKAPASQSPSPSAAAAAPSSSVRSSEPTPNRQPLTASSLELRVPDIGDFKDVEVIDVLVKVGDKVEVDSSVLTLETEKATMDVPSTNAGTIKSLAIKKGDRVSKGSLIGTIEAVSGSGLAIGQKGSEASALPATSSPPAVQAAQVRPQADAAPTPEPTPNRQPPTASIDEGGFSRAHASPSVRRFARELGVDLSRVRGSGIKSRITPEDVKAWVKQALGSGAGSGGGTGLPKLPEVDFSKFGAIEVKPLSRIQKISGPRLHASWVNIPHVWQMDEADITDLEETRNRLKT